MRVRDPTAGPEQDAHAHAPPRPQVPPHHTRTHTIRRRDRRTRLCLA